MSKFYYNFISLTMVLFTYANQVFATEIFDKPAPTSVGYIVEKGHDYEVLSVNADQYNSAIFQATGKQGKAVSPKRIYVIKSFEGVRNSSLSMAVKNELLGEYGGDIYTLPTMESPTIFVDEELANSATIEEKTPVSDIYLEKTSTNTKSQNSSVCKKWYDWSKSDFKQQIPNINKGLSHINEPGFVGQTEANLGSRGFVSAGASGRYKVNWCVSSNPYKIEVKNSRVKGEIYLDNASLGLKGNILNYNKSLFEATLYHSYFDVAYFCVWFVCFDLDAEIEAKTGMNFGLNASASLAYKGLLSGYMKFDYICKSGSCIENTPTIKDFNVTSENNELLSSIEGKIQATPWISLEAGMILALYHRELELANVMAEINFSLPITVQGYYGNNCGDANQDGSNELVKGLLFDVSGLIALSMKLETLGASVYIAVPIALQDWIKDEDCDGCILKEFDHLVEKKYKKVIGKSFYFKDFMSDGSTVFSPVITGLYDSRIVPHPTDHMAVLGLGALQLSNRQCHPFGTKTKYLIDWGDGLSEYASVGSKSIKSLTHRWHINKPYPSKKYNYLVRATPIEDSFGRKFSPTTTSRYFSL